MSNWSLPEEDVDTWIYTMPSHYQAFSVSNTAGVAFNCIHKTVIVCFLIFNFTVSKCAGERYWRRVRWFRDVMVEGSNKPITILKDYIHLSPTWMICSTRCGLIPSTLPNCDGFHAVAACCTNVHIPGSFLSFAQPCAWVLPRAWYSIWYQCHSASMCMSAATCLIFYMIPMPLCIHAVTGKASYRSTYWALI